MLRTRPEEGEHDLVDALVLAGQDVTNRQPHLARFHLVAAPAVFLGRADVIVEEAEEDIKALGGVSHDEELSDTVWTIARGRFNWLLVNLATAFLALAFLATMVPTTLKADDAPKQGKRQKGKKPRKHKKTA